MKIEYLLFNVIVLFFSTLGCLLYKNRSWPKFSAASISISLISGLFIIWDQFVTGWWWKFNDGYTVGIKFGKLPIEEILFFLIIPWSCLVIWENLKKKVRNSSIKNIEAVVILGGSITGIAGLFNGWWYTAAVGGGVAGTGLLSYLCDHWFRKKAAWMFLGSVCVLTVIFNGYLTARPVVVYDPSVISELYIGTIPIEDILYGLILMSAVVMTYEYLKKGLYLSLLEKIEAFRLQFE